MASHNNRYRQTTYFNSSNDKATLSKTLAMAKCLDGGAKVLLYIDDILYTKLGTL